MSESKRSFWTSIPGFVTGLAGLLTAIVGLVTVLIQLDVIGGDSNGSEDSPSAVSTTVGGGAQTGVGGATPTTEAPRFTVSPTTLDFTGGAREKTVQVKNVSSAARLSLSQPTFTGKDSSQFDAVLDKCASPLGPGLSCDLKVTFTPSGPLRTYEARLQLTAPGARGEEVQVKATTIL